LRRYQRKSVGRRVSKGEGQFERKFQTVGGVASQPLLVSETRLIVRQTDGQTDRLARRWTDRRTELQELIPRYHSCFSSKITFLSLWGALWQN